MINSFLQKLSTWVTVKSNISTRIDLLLLTSVTFLRAILMCSAFTPDCGYDNSTIILIGDLFCPNTEFSVKLCLHKKTFQSLGRSDCQCPQCASVCQVRDIPFEDQTNSFFFWLGQGVYFWRESTINSRCYWRCVLSWQVLFQQREMRISWRLCNNSDVHLWLWNVRSLVVCSQSSFYVTVARKDDKKQAKHAFSLPKKHELGTEQTIVS